MPENKYMFFWFDCDVSDCVIGRFFIDDSQEEVIASVEAWLEECIKGKNHEIIESYDNGIVGYHKMPLEYFKGWLKF